MDWIQSMQQAIAYIEAHLLGDITPDQVAKHVHSAPDHFSRVFHMITGHTLQAYIRNRRLSLAGQEALKAAAPILSLSLKYRYETPESFTKAFSRFHGASPTTLAKDRLTPRRFDPLTLKISLTGGFEAQNRTLAGVPYITQSTKGYVYLTSFVGALYAALATLGEPYPHEALLFYSGLGNRLCWTPGRWIFGNEDPEHVNRAPFAMQDLLMRMVGWSAKHIPLKDPAGHPLPIPPAQTRRDFISMIDRGIPVIAQGITDDGCKHDWDVFFGYEADGARIIGWDFYQKDDRPLTRADWEAELTSYVLLLEREPPWPERDRALAAFESIVSLAHQGALRGRTVGFTAWEALLADLAQDDFTNLPLTPDESKTAAPAQDGVQNIAQRFIIYCDALCQINDRTQVAASCRALAAAFGEWAPALSSAADAWEACAAYGGYLWTQGLSFSPEGYERFRRQDIRETLAAEGARAYALEREAVAQIESILASEHN